MSYKRRGELTIKNIKKWQQDTIDKYYTVMPKENEIISILIGNEDFTKYVDTEYKFDRNAVRVFKVAKSVLKAAIAYLDEIEEELSEITKSIFKIIND